MPALDSISATLLASIRSVGTAVTMASVGLYAHNRGFVDNSGKRTLAVISQQITFPLFLFTKIIYCNQNWSDEPCPDVTRSLQDVWILMIWPAYVVAVGMLVGAAVARLTKTPPHQTRAVLAACCFGNSTGLPITLLTVVHANFPTTSDLGRIDPTLFLSVYLLLYPVLQWGLGGWLLAPSSTTQEEDKDNTVVSSNRRSSLRNSFSESFRNHVLSNDKDLEEYSHRHHCKGLTSTDEGIYLTELDLTALLQREQEREASSGSSQGNDMATDFSSLSVMQPNTNNNDSNRTGNYQRSQLSEVKPLLPPHMSDRSSGTGQLSDIQQSASGDPWHTVRNILDRSLQPPVVGAISGIVVAILPGVRGIFVDLVDRDSSAPLQWLFDGLYAVGLTAVPINMLILGANLSASLKSLQQQRKDGIVPVSTKDEGKSGLMSFSTMLGIVIGKMVVLPFIGILTGWILKKYVWDIPSDIDGSFYLVLMIVFLCPTANNVMVMVELSGSGAKEGIAQVIAMQYAVAPLILSLTMTVAIGVASEWT